MKRIAISLFVLALGACGESAPPSKPAAQPEPATTPAPQAAAPETKAPEAPASSPAADPNKELAQRVKRALEGNRQIPAGAIDVTAQSGRVSLWGTTATAAERDLAGQIAARVDGVASVDNQLKVVKGS
jgi:type IV pilus biogenesis protein CpaD/CtpE